MWRYSSNNVSLLQGCLKLAISKTIKTVPNAIKVITSYSYIFITLLLLCTLAPLAFCCDCFNHGSRQAKHDLVDLVMVDHDVTLCRQISEVLFKFAKLITANTIFVIIIVLYHLKLSFFLFQSATTKKSISIVTQLLQICWSITNHFVKQHFRKFRFSENKY